MKKNYADLIIVPDKNSIALTRDAGEKASVLVELSMCNYNIPDFIILNTEIHALWKTNKKFSKDLLETIKNTLSERGIFEFSVRSSAVGEDGKNQSHAGIFKTVLGVQAIDLESALESVYRSVEEAFAGKLSSYSGLSNQSLCMAVIIQKMLKPQWAGVVFTQNPIGHPGLVVIDACEGLGTGVVEGKKNVLHFEYDRFLNLVYKNSDKKSDTQNISIELQTELVRTSLELETKLKFPVDVEWAIESNKIYILQARPITTGAINLRYYVDTNLAESYAGVSSPLTIHFVKKIYYKTFHDTAKFLGASTQRLKILDGVYARLLADFEGHLYYDLNSYYAAISALPDGEDHLTRWHKMIGGKHVPIVEIPSFPSMTIFEKIKFAFAITKLHFSYDRVASEFKNRGNELLKRFSNKLDHANTVQELASVFVSELEHTQDLSFPILNDFLLMRKLKGNSNVDRFSMRMTLKSIEPQIKLDELIQVFEKNDQLKLAVHSGVAYVNLKSQYPLEVEKLDRFLQEYGDRCFEDLKLETKVYRLFPDEFLKFLCANMTAKLTPMHAVDPLKDKKAQSAIEKYIQNREELRFLRSKYYGLYRQTLYKLDSLLKTHIPWKDLFRCTLDDLQKLASGQITEEKFINILINQLSWQRPDRLVFPEFYSHPDTQDFISPYFLKQNKQIKSTENSTAVNSLYGTCVSSGDAEAEVIVIHHPGDVIDVSLIQGKILVTSATDPAWVYYLKFVAGLISEKGSLLSHTAIISRELGVPCIIGIKNAAQILKNHQRVKMIGSSGVVIIQS